MVTPQGHPRREGIGPLGGTADAKGAVWARGGPQSVHQQARGGCGSAPAAGRVSPARPGRTRVALSRAGVRVAPIGDAVPPSPLSPSPVPPFPARVPLSGCHRVAECAGYL